MSTPSTTSGTTLRLIWPQWQGAGSAVVGMLASEFPLDIARHGYAVGTRVLEAVLPLHEGPTARVPVAFDATGLEEIDGIEAKAVILVQLKSALDAVEAHAPERILTLGGECSVSVAPFASLAAKYGDDLAVVWIDSHPDVGTGRSEYHGYHAMAVAAIIGHGDPDVHALLPAIVPPVRVALAGLHSWTDDDYPNAERWGVSSFSPSDLRESSVPLLTWLAKTGCSRVAIHLDVDVVDSDEAILGLGAESGGMSSDEVRRLIADISRIVDVVGLTIAEYFPRQVMHVTRLLTSLPLV